MRMLRAAVAMILGLALVMLGAPAASASDTYHGTLAGGVGYNVGGVGEHPIARGEHPLDLAGEWNVNVGTQGIQVVGNLRTATRLKECGLPPCPFGMSLQAGDPWVQTAPGVFTSTLDTGLVQFRRTLYTDPAAPYVLEMSITGCPYGWQSWRIPGASRQG